MTLRNSEDIIRKENLEVRSFVKSNIKKVFDFYRSNGVKERQISVDRESLVETGIYEELSRLNDYAYIAVTFVVSLFTYCQYVNNSNVC